MPAAVLRSRAKSVASARTLRRCSGPASMRRLMSLMSRADSLVVWGAWSVVPCDAVCPGGGHSDLPGLDFAVVAFRPFFGLVTMVTTH